MNNMTHRFRRGNNLYLVKADDARSQTYVVFHCDENEKNERSVTVSYRITTDRSIYDYCDSEEAETLKHSDNFHRRHIEAKCKAVALFRQK